MDQHSCQSILISHELAQQPPTPFPSSLGFVKRKEIVNLQLVVLEGSIPDDLYGHAFFVGPGGFTDSQELGDSGLILPSSDGTPLFNGDPLVHRLDFSKNTLDGKVEVYITNKIPRTPCYYTDWACQNSHDFKGFRYDNYGLARLSFQLGFRNEVNTAVIPMKFNEEEGYRLLLTWDAGRPFEIDPVSLEVATAVGSNEEWKEQIDLPLPFGIYTTPAHPVFVPAAKTETGGRGRLFTLNYGKSIGTALHPIINRYVDAPFTRTDQDLTAILNNLIDQTEFILKAISAGVHSVQWLAKWLPESINQIGKNIAVSLTRLTRDVLKPRSAPRAELSTSSVSSRLFGLVHELLQKTETPNQPLSGKSLEESLSELQRLIGVLRGLLPQAKAMSDFVHLISWDGENPLHQWKILLNEDPNKVPLRIMQSMHQIGVTENHVILMDTVFKLGAEQLLTSPAPDFPELERLIRDLLDFRQSDKTVLYIIDRNDLRTDVETVIAKRIELDRSTAHFLVDYKSPNNNTNLISLHCVHNNGWDAAEWVRTYDRFSEFHLPGVVGMATGSTDINVMGHYVINVDTGTVEKKLAKDPENNLSWMLALYAFCQPDGVTPPDNINQIFWNGWGSHCDLLPDYIQALNEPAKPRILSVNQAVEVASHGLAPTLLRLDTGEMEIKDQYVLPQDCFANSVQFIPRLNAHPGSSDGYLMCIVNRSNQSNQNEFWIFDAQNLGAGPLCRLGHAEVKVGLTIHSTWVPRIQPRKATYCVSVRDDYDKRLEHINAQEEVIQMFRDYVYPNFPSTNSNA
ncbi:MAG: carotenoid oxygenase family protein [Cyanobacteriota bacterium]